MVVLAVVACMMLYGAYSERVRRAELMGDAISEAAQVGITLDVVLNDLLAHRDLTEMAHLPDEISEAERIFGLAVFDIGAGAVVSSRSVTPLRPQLRVMAEAALRTGRPLARETYVNGTHVAVYAFPLRRDGHDVVGAAVLLRDLTYMEQHIASSWRRIATVGLLLALFVMMVVVIVTRVTVARPVAALIDGVRRIGVGDLSHPIAVEGPSETARVARAINQMMTDLDAARAQIRRDLEARIQLEQSVEFERRMQHTQRLATVGQLAASLAHEIGSPLHVIAGRARLAATSENVEVMRENLEVIAKQSDRITRIVEQLLALARKRQRRDVPVRLAEVARNVVELLAPQARQQKVELAVVERASDVLASGDPDELQQVLFNLVMNAVQAQPKGGAVEVVLDAAAERDSLGTSRPRAVMEVRDRGPGVAPDKREAIFEPFMTGREHSGGTGLGLSVVRGVVRHHAGAIKVLDNPGGGAIFRVSLPSADE